MILKTRILGEPVLRERARPLQLKEILSKETQELIASMRETMRDAPGVGLAAPQVGLPLQLAVIEDREEYGRALGPDKAAERERRPVPFHVVVNPVLTLDSAPDVEFFEGCLSLERPDVGILSDEFLEDVCKLKERNLAVEVLERLLKGQVKSRFASKVVQSRKFSELLQEAPYALSEPRD